MHPTDAKEMAETMVRELCSIDIVPLVTEILSKMDPNDLDAVFDEFGLDADELFKKLKAMSPDDQAVALESIFTEWCGSFEELRQVCEHRWIEPNVLLGFVLKHFGSKTSPFDEYEALESCDLTEFLRNLLSICENLGREGDLPGDFQEGFGEAVANLTKSFDDPFRVLDLVIDACFEAVEDGEDSDRLRKRASSFYERCGAPSYVLNGSSSQQKKRKMVEFGRSLKALGNG